MAQKHSLQKGATSPRARKPIAAKRGSQPGKSPNRKSIGDENRTQPDSARANLLEAERLLEHAKCVTLGSKVEERRSTAFRALILAERAQKATNGSRDPIAVEIHRRAAVAMDLACDIDERLLTPPKVLGRDPAIAKALDDFRAIDGALFQAGYDKPTPDGRALVALSLFLDAAKRKLADYEAHTAAGLPCSLVFEDGSLCFKPSVAEAKVAA